MARKKRSGRLKKTKQRTVSKSPYFTKISDLLVSPVINETIKKGLKDEIQKPQKRTDPREIQKLHQRSIKRQYARRELMLRQVAERQRRLTQQQTIPVRADSRLDNKNDDICRSRRAKRLALFASRKIGKGKGSGTKRTYNETSKTKC